MLNEIVRDKPGTYAGLRFSNKSINKFNKLIDRFDIPNKVGDDIFHSTLLFSRKHLPKFKALGKLKNKMIGIPNTCEIWNTSGDKPKQALVLKFGCKEQIHRHKELMDLHKGTYDFPNYIPHVTLSYNVGEDFDLDELNKYIKDNRDKLELEIDSEYQEELDLNWG